MPRHIVHGYPLGDCSKHFRYHDYHVEISVLKADGKISDAVMAHLKTLQDLFNRMSKPPGSEPLVIAFPDAGTCFEPQVWSGEDITESARQLAGGLVERDFTSHAPVALMAPNSPGWVACFWGLVMAGRIVMPLDRQMGETERQNCLEHSGCKQVFTTVEYASWFKDKDIAVYFLDGDQDAPQSWRSLFSTPIVAPPLATPEDIACLLYTSGTTGSPKGVPLSHRNLTSNVEAVLAEGIAGNDDRILLPLPLHHAYPLTIGLLSGVACGATLVFPGGLGGPQLVEAATQSRATMMVAVPRLYAALLAGIEARVGGGWRGAAFKALFELSKTVRRRWGVALGRVLFRRLRNRIGPTLRVLICGGARLDPDVAWGLEALGWTVLSGYGLTETSPILTFNTPNARNLETAGRPLPGVDVRSAVQEGKRKSEGGGEVQVRGPNVFAGYLDNPEATRASFTQDGWFRTGDVGYLDENRFLHLIGRTSDLIVLADGKNIVPEDVEKVYLESPFIREMAVIEHKGLLVGILVPDVDAIRTYGAARLQELMREEVDIGSLKLPSYRRVHGYRLWREPLPRNPLGKLRRHLLGDIYEQSRYRASSDQAPRLSDADRRFIDETKCADVWAWLLARFPDVALSLETSPQLDLDLDSLGWLTLTLELDETFAVRLNDEAVGRITSLRDLLQEIAATRSGAVDGAQRPPRPATDWISPQSRADKRLGRLIHGAARFLTTVLLRMQVQGLSNLPSHGPFILAINHISYLDPVCVYGALPRDVLERTFFVGWTGILFKNKLMRLISRATRTFPVNPDHGVDAAITLGTEVIKRGDALVLFPEGRVSGDGEMLRFQPGIGLLAARTGAPIVPARISGTFELMPRGWRLRRFGKVYLVIGAPLDGKQLLDEAPTDNTHQYIAQRVQDAVTALMRHS